MEKRDQNLYSLGVILANTPGTSEEVLSSISLIMDNEGISYDEEKIVEAYMNTFEDMSEDDAKKELREKLDYFI